MISQFRSRYGEAYQLLEAKIRAMVKEDINKKAKQSFDVIQRSRSAIREHFNLINKEVESVINKRTEYAALLDSRALPAEIAESEFAEAINPLFEYIAGEWTQESSYLKLSTSWMSEARTPPSNPPQQAETRKTRSTPNTNNQAVQDAGNSQHQTKISTNVHMLPLLEEKTHQLSRGILHKICERPRVQCSELTNKAYVFEWPGSNGIYCAIKCWPCNVLNTSNPLAEKTSLAVGNHWRSTHLEYKEYGLKKLYWEIMSQYTYRVEGVTPEWLQRNNDDIKLKNHKRGQKRKQRQGQNPAERPCSPILISPQIYNSVTARNQGPGESYDDTQGSVYSAIPLTRPTLTERNAYTGFSHASSVGDRDGSIHREPLAWSLRSASTFDNSHTRSINREQDPVFKYTFGSLQKAPWSHVGHDHVRNYNDVIAGYGDGEEGEDQDDDMEEDCSDDVIFIRENVIGPTVQGAEPESFKAARDIRADPGSE
ncbi:hypothetical protein PG993_004563 [Apiospora rasikravindrae]|uniref:Uncharacterized protein n=1 Tax=Apiospora rasikravindrae TaxID=990691 RepID=A0ABR1TFL3_9PEZI